MYKQISEKSNTRADGRFGEAAVCGYLERCGYKILHRNWYSGHEEIDIICEDEKSLVFVEVKTRRAYRGGASKYGSPAAAVNFTKRKHVAAAAARYISLNPSNKIKRIDVADVTYEPVGDSAPGFVAVTIRHIKGAFGAGGVIV